MNLIVSVAQALFGNVISFRRWLFGDLRTSWEKIWHDACNFQLRGDHDTVVWKLRKSNMFTVKSVYNGLSKSESGIYHKGYGRGRYLQRSRFFYGL